MAYKAKPIYMLSPIEPPTFAFNQAVDSFLNDRWLPKHSFSDSRNLHHYTDFTGLKGILQTRSFWFGHSTCFNDPTEIQYGRELISGILQDRMKKEDREDIRAFLEQISVHVSSFGKYMLHVFAACFCEAKNLWSQWQTYADRGGGYCLGMDFSDCTKFTSDPDNLDNSKPLCLRKVIYRPDEQKELVSCFLSSMVRAAKDSLGQETRRASTPEEVGELLRMAALPSNILFDMLLTFKHPAFESEKEWRMIRVTLESHESEHIMFRETEDGVIPYRQTVTFEDDENDVGNSPYFPLHSIGFGPSLDPNRSRAALELLVAHIAATDHPIKMQSHLQIEEPGFSLR